MVMKLALLASPLPLVAAVLAIGDGPTQVVGGTEEDRACQVEGAEVGHAKVRVPWTPIRRIDDDVEALFCVVTGDADSPLLFERNADRVRFTLVSGASTVKEGDFQFIARTSANNRIELRRATIRIAPGGQPSCRIEVCQAFTDPGERIVAVEVRSFLD